MSAPRLMDAPCTNDTLNEVAEALSTPAWRLVGLMRSEPGSLELRSGRLAFLGEDGALFDVPLAEVRNVVFPWYNFGAGIQFEVSGREHRFGFLRPTSEGGNLSGIRTGREAGRRWRTVFKQIV